MKISIDEAYNRFKGKGGNPESESILNDSNGNKQEGIVYFWSNKCDIAKIIDKCGKAIKSCEVVGDGIQFTIERRAFRGMHGAFKKIK